MILSRKGFIPPSGKFPSGLNCRPVALGWHDIRGAEANADNGRLPSEIDERVNGSAWFPESSELLAPDLGPRTSDFGLQTLDCLMSEG